MSKPQLKLVSASADVTRKPLPRIESACAMMSHYKDDGARLYLTFSQEWADLLPARIQPIGDLYGDGLTLCPFDGDERRNGVYTRTRGSEDGFSYQLHARFVGRDLVAGNTIPLLYWKVGPLGLELRAVSDTVARAASAGALAPATAQSRATRQGSLPLEVPPAGNLIEQLRIAVSNVNSIVTDLPGCVLRIEDNRIKAGVEI